jgi:Fic family protein
MMLGEAASKCEHIAGVPLNPEAAAQIHRLYLTKGALATVAIEGNTLTEKEAQDYLDGTSQLPPSQQYLGKEIDNIIFACNFLTQQIAEHGAVPMSVEQIKWMNEQILRELRLDEEVSPGKIRTYSVGVPGYRGAPAEECQYLLSKLCETLNQFPMPAERKEVYALIKAIFAHLYLVWIHPFGDGNGRTARLMELYILLCAGLPQPVGHLLSNHYNKTRSEYYRRLNEARLTEDGITNFVKYAVQGFIDGLREELQVIRGHQWNDTWINYVHEQLRDKPGLAHRRQRELVLCLSKQSEFVAVNKIRFLSPELAASYATLTTKALTRDLNILARMDLIERKRGSVRAKRDKILAYWRNK